MENKQQKLKIESKLFYKMLSKLYHDVSKTLTLKEALLTLVNLTTAVIGCERATIFLNDKKSNELFCFATCD